LSRCGTNSLGKGRPFPSMSGCKLQLRIGSVAPWPPSMRILFLFFIVFVVLLSSPAPRAEDQVSPTAAKADGSRSAPAEHRSKHFLLHSDLPKAEAEALLVRLESMLQFISGYWGRPLAGRIECFVVGDLKNWPAGSLDTEGRKKIEQGVGITLVDTETVDGQPTRSTAVVYSVAKPGTVLHEVVHAYCGQTFHRAGPLWYAEGMAEVGQYWRGKDFGIRCPPVLIKHLKLAERMTAEQIVNETAATGDSWKSYAQRWALCQMLVDNPNYSERFRALGRAYLAGDADTFEDHFSKETAQLEFEHRFFIDHLCQGFRGDLAAWDWSKKFEPLASGARAKATILAQRGWQPTGVTLKAGSTYIYSAKGEWHLAKEAKPITAVGNKQGIGRLVGIVMKDWQLSRPFTLGEQGSFKAEAGGDLYLRCEDDWGSLGDNAGELSVSLAKAGP
jgi:hypothetical protein